MNGIEVFNWNPHPWALPSALGLVLGLGLAWVGAIRLAHWTRQRRAPPRPPAQEVLRRVAQQRACEALRPMDASLRIVQDERHPGAAPVDAMVFGLDREGVTFRARCDLAPGVHIQAELDLADGARHCLWWFEVARIEDGGRPGEQLVFARHFGSHPEREAILSRFRDDLGRG